ncbi:hypothetical protein PENTCL1PPCAC_29248 [Pristionchus entomophagus]|uniref:Secreted protein n=1 Tax=Pristionchus entomophagus TaxID=358040 RepID=A0AAV5UMC3_9BILA|nr:hypothetical protein PENTCL1PPCAC_29248 [Pristionchus entomophagus]
MKHIKERAERRPSQVIAASFLTMCRFLLLLMLLWNATEGNPCACGDSCSLPYAHPRNVPMPYGHWTASEFTVYVERKATGSCVWIPIP